ncbi:MAG: hypothetical protein GYB68_06085, partial [Chloroflexi bacterium]|nr:hypothetical protein [Chloroflexota bacterium]
GGGGGGGSSSGPTSVPATIGPTPPFPGPTSTVTATATFPPPGIPFNPTSTPRATSTFPPTVTDQPSPTPDESTPTVLPSATATLEEVAEVTPEEPADEREDNLGDVSCGVVPREVIETEVQRSYESLSTEEYIAPLWFICPEPPPVVAIPLDPEQEVTTDNLNEVVLYDCSEEDCAEFRGVSLTGGESGPELVFSASFLRGQPICGQGCAFYRAGPRGVASLLPLIFFVFILASLLWLLALLLARRRRDDEEEDSADAAADADLQTSA